MQNAKCKMQNAKCKMQNAKWQYRRSNAVRPVTLSEAKRPDRNLGCWDASLSVTGRVLRYDMVQNSFTVWRRREDARMR